MRIEITKTVDGHDLFTVDTGDRIATHLTFDEMLGLVASLTMPPRACMGFMKPKKRIEFRPVKCSLRSGK